MGIPLDTPLTALQNTQRFLPKLKKLGIETVRDLLWNFPARYEDYSEVRRIEDLTPGEQVTVQGVIDETSSRRAWRQGMAIVDAHISDDTGSVRATWFNQPYLRETLRPGRLLSLSGKVSLSEKGELYLSHPTFEFISDPEHAHTRHTARLVPIYGETKGLTSKGIRYLTEPILQSVETEEWLPPEVLAERKFPPLLAALRAVHFPSTLEEAEAARRRFAFEELFLLQLATLKQKIALIKTNAAKIPADITWLKEILAGLPFELTQSQKLALWDIIRDLDRTHPMNRLLQGDVGSGKTAVAALASLIAAKAGFQAAFMAPTEILARQHFETIKKLFAGVPDKEMPAFGILAAGTGQVFYEKNVEGKVSKKEFLKKLADGEISIALGTHALIQKGVHFRKLGLAIVDEQHRFGVHQRAELLAQTNADSTQTNMDLLYGDLTYKIRGCIFKVKEELGLGHKEIIYQKALAEEFKSSGIKFEQEKAVDVKYKGKKVGVYKPDFLINNKVIVELKTLPRIGPLEQRQIWTYLKGTDYELALLINFSTRTVDIHRIVYESARKSRRESASGPHESALPHYLSMSATPIPRTLTLTVFGDLDVSLITELPAGRKEIETRIVPSAERAATYDFIRKKIKEGRQAFVICPRIDVPESEGPGLKALSPRASLRRLAELEVKSVKAEYERLAKKVFPDLRLAMLHGRMKTEEKDKIMREFKDGRTDILISTSVVEVGVDVQNAVIMLIESSDRFGLAQLYQFRGRVGRGEHKSYCFLMTESDAQTANARLKALVAAKNGFELAEYDLKLRGPGEFLGESQTGLPDIAMESLGNAALVEESRQAAKGILEKDPALKKYPVLRKRLAAFSKKIHLE